MGGQAEKKGGGGAPPVEPRGAEPGELDRLARISSGRVNPPYPPGKAEDKDNGVPAGREDVFHYGVRVERIRLEYEYPVQFHPSAARGVHHGQQLFPCIEQRYPAERARGEHSPEKRPVLLRRLITGQAVSRYRGPVDREHGYVIE